MRNAALVLGIIAGILAMFVGFFGFGYTQVIDEYGEIQGFAEQLDNVSLVRIAAVLGPLMAIAGGAMAKVRALWGGILLAISAVTIYAAFGFNVFTMFPISFAGLAAIFAVAAGKPDEPKAHF